MHGRRRETTPSCRGRERFMPFDRGGMRRDVRLGMMIIICKLLFSLYTHTVDSRDVVSLAVVVVRRGRGHVRAGACGEIAPRGTSRHASTGKSSEEAEESRASHHPSIIVSRPIIRGSEQTKIPTRAFDYRKTRRTTTTKQRISVCVNHSLCFVLGPKHTCASFHLSSSS